MLDRNDTEERTEPSGRTAAARKAVARLGNPRDIQRKNLLAVLDWLYRWGYSTADILTEMLERKNRTHAKRLIEAGWIQSVSVRGYPTYLVLTEKGLAEAIHHATDLYEYKEADPYRVSLPLLHHNLTVQRQTVRAIQLGGYQDFMTPRMYKFSADRQPLKIPDAIMIWKSKDEFGMACEEWTGLEIELTPKWNHHLDMFVTNIVDDIQYGRLHFVLVCTDSKVIKERYESAFKPGRKVKLWQKSGTKFVDAGNDLVIPDWVGKRVIFRDIDENLIHYPTNYLP